MGKGSVITELLRFEEPNNVVWFDTLRRHETNTRGDISEEKSGGSSID